MKKGLLPFLILIGLNTMLFAQAPPFQVYLEPLTIPSVGGLQSFAFGQHAGKWLVLGGRLDGLHRRQPFAAFDAAGNNTQILVIDPVGQQSWSAPLNALPVSMSEQLSSTNMEFHQNGDYLYIIGGYGYSNTAANHKTYDQLTAVDVPSVINAIISGTSYTTYFRQITDSVFAVTGGHLKKINDTYYLLGGNKFTGAYNPMGGPTYTQNYTNAVRKFNLDDDGTNITITHLPAYVDPTNLHRRDYNAVEQIMPDGSEGVTMFSGVFQPTVDLPFLNCVNVDSLTYSVNNSFQQLYNHYHCPVVPLYATGTNEMYSVFFGGIAQFYDSLGVLVQDNNVPFVKTIATVTRDGAGSMTEHKMGTEMPNWIGASAEFIPLQSISTFNNGVIDFDQLINDTSMVGYIYGGISSTAKNIFFINTGIESAASNQIFKVYIIKNPVGIDEHDNDHEVQLLIFPNPNNGGFNISFNAVMAEAYTITLTDQSGRLIKKDLIKAVGGDNEYRLNLRSELSAGIYTVSLVSAHKNLSKQIVIKR